MPPRRHAHEIDRKVGDRAMAYRTIADLSQEAVGAAVGELLGRDAMTGQAVGKYERGETVWTAEMIVAFAAVVKQHPRALFPNGEGMEFPPPAEPELWKLIRDIVNLEMPFHRHSVVSNAQHHVDTIKAAIANGDTKARRTGEKK